MLLLSAVTHVHGKQKSGCRGSSFVVYELLLFSFASRVVVLLLILISLQGIRREQKFNLLIEIET